jgi:hypothetical protein
MRSRIQYTESQKAQMWSRWQQGESLHEIARLFDRFHTSVRGILAESGGIRPPPRRRSSRVLSLAERGLMAGIDVYFFRRCDDALGEMVTSKRAATLEAIQGGLGSPIFESRHTVDESDLNGNGMVRPPAE